MTNAYLPIISFIISVAIYLCIYCIFGFIFVWAVIIYWLIDGVL